MKNTTTRRSERRRRHRSIRKKIAGTAARPRLSVFRSHQHVYAQVIDDVAGHTLASASTVDKEVREKLKYGGNKDAAVVVGEHLAKRAKEKGIEAVIFDRGGNLFHGRVKALADAAREHGLQF